MIEQNKDGGLMNPLRHKFLPISFLVSCLGLIFSAYNIVSVFIHEDTCLFNSCSIFSNFNFMGFSLWWVSAIFFALILIFSLFGFALAIRLITAWALLADLGLLFVMINTTMCVKCIGAGILLACSYYAVRYENRRPCDPYPKTLLLNSWLILLIALLGAGYAAILEGFPIKQGAKTTTNIFFSPSCSACIQLVKKEYNNPNIAWYPVEEDENDVWYILYMDKQLQAGDNLLQALEKAKNAKPEEQLTILDAFSFEYFSMQYKLWKNSSIVKRRTNTIPYIEVFGTSKDLLGNEKQNTTIQVQDTKTVESLLGTDTALCGESIPCE